MMRGGNMYRNPWYRGYMPRSYIAPHRLASFGCACCLVVFGVFFLFGGTMAIVMSKHADNLFKKQDEDPRFQSEFFKKAREDRKKSGFDHSNITNVIYTIGLIFICFGGVFILSAIGLCLFAKFHMEKNRNKQTNPAGIPLNEGGTYPPPPPGSYPQQPPPPPTGSYPQQYTPVPGMYPQQPVMTSYPEQTAPPAYPYSPPTQQPPPSEPYVSDNTKAPYPESQGYTAVNPPPVGFKEG